MSSRSSTPRLRVIQVTMDDLGDLACGKSRSIATLVDHLRRAGVDVRVVAPEPHPVRWLVRAACYVIAGVHRPIGKRLRRAAYSPPFIRGRLAREVAEAEAAGLPYVVHARDHHSLLAFARLRRPGSLARAVLTVHHYGSAAEELLTERHVRPGGRLEAEVRRQERRALAAADVVVTPSRRSRDALLAAVPGLDPDLVTVVPNPVVVAHARVPVTRASLGVADDAFVVLAANRMKRVKRVDLLLAAAAAARARVPRLRVLVAGDGYQMPHVRREVARLGLDDVVTLLGERADVPDLIGLADVVALTSAGESFGRVLAEGATVGRPLVAFDVGGVTESVVDGRTGFLVPFGDVGAFADRLVAIADDDALRQGLGLAASHHARRFRPERVAEEHLRLFEALCADRGAADLTTVAAG